LGGGWENKGGLERECPADFVDVGGLNFKCQTGVEGSAVVRREPGEGQSRWGMWGEEHEKKGKNGGKKRKKAFTRKNKNLRGENSK